MAVIRITKQKNFSIISNIPLNDSRLSFKAKGMWSYLMSKPDDWVVRVGQLVKSSREGKTAIYSGINELVQYGYMDRVQLRDDSGRMSGVEYLVNEEPRACQPYSENRDTENPDLDNVPILKTDKELKTDDDKSPPPPPLNSDLEKLVQEIPADKQTPQVAAKIRKGLQAGHLYQYLALAIAYSLAHSNENFAGYLGMCIDDGWHEGWDPAEKQDELQVDYQEYQVQLAMDQKQAQDRERKQAALAALKADPEKYHAAQVDAAKALGIDLDRLKRGDRLKMDLYIANK